jgi:dTDP-4-amino-4,6-dideoxygalactose transaminase
VPPNQVSKTRWDELALFGGTPAFPEPLHVGRPSLPDKGKFLKLVDRIWETGVLSNNGPYVQELEHRFCELTGAEYAIATSNATIGLQLVARAMELEGEIILPSFTFIATAHAFRWEGLKPVFCDVDPVTQTLDPARVEELISDDTCAIAGVELWGNPCHPALEEIAKANGVRLILDSAHALGCSTPLRPSTFNPRPSPDAQVFSLHATKIISGFEGGMITTDSQVLAHQLRLLRNFGFAGYDDVRGLGTNAKMCEVSAAMALCSLDELSARIDHNRENYAAYVEGLSGVPGIELQIPAEPETANCQYVVIRVEETRDGFHRDGLMKALWAEGIRARRYFYPGCHGSNPYRWECRDAAERLPVTETLCREVLALPTGSSVGSSEVETICAIVKSCVAASRRIVELDLAKAA